MRDLISGEEAKLAWANNELVLYSLGSSGWNILNNTDFYSSIFNNKQYSFKLKPKTIMLNGMETPAPFIPVVGELYYYINPRSRTGYSKTKFTCSEIDSYSIQYGAYRTEDEIKQIREALRNVFGGSTN